MTRAMDIETRADTLRVLLRERLGVGGRDLAAALRRAGRRLPRDIRRKAEVIRAAQVMGRNPKLARRLDPAAIDSAFRSVSSHLEAIDLADLRRGRLLGWLGALVFNLLLVSAAFVVWLWWRGYV